MAFPPGVVRLKKRLLVPSTGTNPNIFAKIDMDRTPVPLKENIDVIQSSFLTDARYNVSRTEMQILIILVAAAQHDIKQHIAMNIEKGGQCSAKPLYRNVIRVAFSLNDFPINMAGHELSLKVAAENLIKKTIQINTETGWILRPLLEKVEYLKKERLVIMDVHPEIWSMIMNIKLGYSEYELFTALSLKSLYSVRFYMMASSNFGPREITFEQLKKQFDIEDKYNDNVNILRRIIYPASKELNEKAPITFSAKPFKRSGSKEYVGFVFTPQKNPSKRNANLEKKKLTHGKICIGMALDPEEIDWLVREDKMAFSRAELSRNFDTFNVAKKKYGPALLDAMNGIYEFMLRNGRGGQKGYFIKSLKQNAQSGKDEATLF